MNASQTSIRLSRPLSRVSLFTGAVPSQDELSGSNPTASMVQNLAQAIQSLNARVVELESRRQNSIDEFRMLAAELGVAIGSKLAMREIEEGEAIAASLLNQWLADVDPSQVCTLRLNPKDHQQVTSMIDQDLDQSRLVLIEDATLSRGDFLIETDEHQFASLIAVKLAEIRHLVLKELSHATVERRRAENSNSGIRRFPDRRSGF